MKEMLQFWRSYIYYYWAGVHRYFGMAHKVRNEFRIAIRYFTKAYEVDPTFRRAKLDRAILLGRELGELDSALADFNSLLAEDPAYGDALFNRALTYQDQGRFGAALEDLEDYVENADDKRFLPEAQRTILLLREIINDAA